MYHKEGDFLGDASEMHSFGYLIISQGVTTYVELILCPGGGGGGPPI